MDNETAAKRYRRKEYSYGVWEFLESLIGDNNALRSSWENRIKEFYNKDKGERKMFLVSAVNVFMYTDEIDFYKSLSFKNTGIIDMKKMELDDYCIDMHCSAGRFSGKNRKDFAIEGCLVVNEYTKYKVDEWREYYISEKLKDTGILKKPKKMAQAKPQIEKKEEPVAETTKIKIQKIETPKIETKKIKKPKKIKKTKKILIIKECPIKIETQSPIEAHVEIQQKIKKEIKSKPKTINPKQMEKNKVEKLNEQLEFISIDDMEFVKLCTNTTCGGKAMCFMVKYNGKTFVLKEGRETMKYNYDYDMVDKCKEIFGLNSIGMKRIRSDKVVEKINKTQKFWENNHHFVNKSGTIYSMMEMIDGKKLIDYRRDVGESKVSDQIWIEFMKIGLFRSIFMVSDFSQINVMIDKNGKLYSIDEHDVLGKREQIAGDKNIKIYQKYSNKISEIMEDLYSNQQDKKEHIKNIMVSYLFEEGEINQIIRNYETLSERFEKEYKDLYKK